MLKQNVARCLRSPEGGLLWQPRYYDFNVWSEAKRIEKLRYLHRNPVKRGLVRSPEDWAWSSFRTICQEWKEWWKLSRNGPRVGENRRESRWG
jgi:putative transposase